MNPRDVLRQTIKRLLMEGSEPIVEIRAPSSWCCRECPSYFANTKGRGECVLKGDIVNGSTRGRPCFKQKGAL